MQEESKSKKALAGVYLFFVGAWMLMSAVPADAASFDCCKCSGGGKDFCALVYPGTGCQNSTDKINAQTNNKYNVTCKPLEAAGCVQISSNKSGQCSNEPAMFDKFDEKFFSASGSVSGTTATSVAPVLGIAIPGIDFSDKIDVDGNNIQVPYLAIYITAFQKYLIGITLAVAAMMLVYGGFKYLLSATGAGVESAKGLIQDALIGLVLVISATVVLSNVNPNTTVFGSLNVPTVKQQGTPIDIAAGRQMVHDAARIPYDSSAMVIDKSSDEVIQERRVSKYGQSALNENGLPIAQGNCPKDMIAIKYSEAYKVKTGKKVKSFCIDRFEAPNAKGQKPYNGVLDIEAAWWCDMYDKRLCTSSEWERACLGPKGSNTYGYGPTFIPGRFFNNGSSGVKAPCNYDSYSNESVAMIAFRDKVLGALNEFYPTQPDGSILTPESQNASLQNEKYRKAYYAAKEFLAKISLAEPSGSRGPLTKGVSPPGCVTEEGVWDMPGNVQEITISDNAATQKGIKNLEDLENLSGSTKMENIFSWKSFYWSPAFHQGSGSGARPTCTISSGGQGDQSHVISWRPFENGFRCCMDLKE